MDNAIVRRIVMAGGVLSAFAAGWHVAQGELGLLALVTALGALALASRGLRVPPDALLGGAVIVGYLTGNRGFAQLSVPGLPLFPGEIALGVGCTLAVWRLAALKTLPFRADGVNALVLLWMAVNAARLPLDVRANGFLALRDFAIVYYALFFVLAQQWSADARGRIWVERCLQVGFTLVFPAFMAFSLWPDFFTLQLTFAGAPLIYVKSDVAGGFMAAGALWFLHRHGHTGQRRWLGPAALNLAGVPLCNSRAALVALLAGVGWLVLVRDRRCLRALRVLLAIGGLVLLADALRPHAPGEVSAGFRIYESLASVADVSGDRTPLSTDLGDKPDNNRFRTVWWQAVLGETWQQAPWFGLGFGSDLAADFLRSYYPEANEDFTVRSPHNIFLTLFGRTGGVGVALFLAVLGAFAYHTWKAGRRGSAAFGPWLAAWAILASATFGVVLEGPMGACLFWTLLGLAVGAGYREEIAADALARLPATPEPVLVEAATPGQLP